MAIDHVVTSGTFSLDGGTWDVDNNVWIVGDDREVIVVDAAHDADAIAAAVGDRRVVAIVCTHGHDDHIDAAPALADRFGAPILLNPAEAPLWDMKWPDRKPDGEIPAELTAGGVTLRALRDARPLPRLDLPLRARPRHGVHRRHAVRTAGRGPPAGRSRRSTRSSTRSARPLLTLPPDTTVCTGHGDGTSIGAEAPHLEEWIARGH